MGRNFAYIISFASSIVMLIFAKYLFGRNPRLIRSILFIAISTLTGGLIEQMFFPRIQIIYVVFLIARIVLLSVIMGYRIFFSYLVVIGYTLSVSIGQLIMNILFYISIPEYRPFSLIRKEYLIIDVVYILVSLGILFTIIKFKLSLFFKDVDIYKYRINLRTIIYMTVVFLLNILNSILTAQLVSENESVLIVRLFVDMSFNIIGFAFILNSLILAISDFENEQLKEFIEMTNDAAISLRAFKHNYLNSLYSIGGYINNERWDSLNIYLNEITQENIERIYNNANLTQIKNIKIKGMSEFIQNQLLKKCYLEVIVKANIPDEITDFEYNENYICKIFEDCVEEAFQKTVKKGDKIVVINIYQSGKKWHIVIDNTYSDEHIFKYLLSLNKKMSFINEINELSYSASISGLFMSQHITIKKEGISD